MEIQNLLPSFHHVEWRLLYPHTVPYPDGDLEFEVFGAIKQGSGHKILSSPASHLSV